MSLLDNTAFVQQANAMAYQQYNSTQSVAAPSAAPAGYVQSETISMPTEHGSSGNAQQQPASQTIHPPQNAQSEDEHQGRFDNGMVFESSALKQQQQHQQHEKSTNSDGKQELISLF